jgi:vacuolar protein sorting-associated protein 13A/C
MFEALIEKLILSRLTGFIQNIDRNQLKISLWNGKIELENVKLDPKILLKLKLPLIFKYSLISKICVLIPWTDLMNKSVEIIIEGIYAILIPFETTPKKKQPQESSSESNLMPEDQFKQSYIQKVKDTLRDFEINSEIENQNKTQPEESKKQNNTYIGNLKKKVIENLKININNVHIRYENIYKGSEFSMGLVIDSISCSGDSEVIYT